MSIVTVGYNSEKTIEDTIRSVAAQDYPDIEYIVVDGASKDGTADICKAHGESIATFVSEPDKGIYDAMNKGVNLATGDVVGILNSDDFYENGSVISQVVARMQETGAESLFADLVIVDPEETGRITRYYSAKDFDLKRFEKGDMPPHPTFFVRRDAYERFGRFKTDYRIAADFELMLRFLYIHRISHTYLPETLVRMRGGGVSSGFKAIRLVNAEIKKALHSNGIPSSTLKIYSKYRTKALQLVRRPKD